MDEHVNEWMDKRTMFVIESNRKFVEETENKLQGEESLEGMKLVVVWGGKGNLVETVR